LSGIFHPYREETCPGRILSSEAIVIEPMEPYPQNGHTVFIDNWLQKKVTGKKQHFTGFRIQLAELMIESVVLPKDVEVHSRALSLSVFILFIGPTLFSSFPPIPKRRILAVTVWCAKLKRRRVEPDTSVPSVW
jgi:hypothetical protein